MPQLASRCFCARIRGLKIAAAVKMTAGDTLLPASMDALGAVTKTTIGTRAMCAPCFTAGAGTVAVIASGVATIRYERAMAGTGRRATVLTGYALIRLLKEGVAGDTLVRHETVAGVTLVRLVGVTARTNALASIAVALTLLSALKNGRRILATDAIAAGLLRPPAPILPGEGICADRAMLVTAILAPYLVLGAGTETGTETGASNMPPPAPTLDGKGMTAGDPMATGSTLLPCLTSCGLGIVTAVGITTVVGLAPSPRR